MYLYHWTDGRGQTWQALLAFLLANASPDWPAAMFFPLIRSLNEVHSAFHARYRCRPDYRFRNLFGSGAHSTP
ncbi:MAG: hypothetical protein CBE43_03340 [Rhodopirellula sp. TMED283]|nr:MAG: hypothetical protein CBE43_03340 [Rhodopirellula sp. TMED283]